MADAETDGIDEAFKGFGEDPAPVTPAPADPATPAPSADPVKDEPADKPKEDEDANKDKPTGDSPDDPTKPGEKVDAPSDSNKPDDPEEKPGDGKPAEPSKPAVDEKTPQPLTKDDVQEVVSNLLNTERSSGKELESTTQEVLDAYYPDGLSNVLIDEKSGKELRTPADVVEVSGGEMTTDQAAQWLMNEQYKLDKQVDKIKDDAKSIASTTLSFKRDAVAAVQKYEPLFKAYPYLQNKVYERLMKQVKVDKEKNVILSAPDVLDHYDFYLEPYQKAFEFSTKQPATNPPPPPEEPAKPSAEDRMDETGDGGVTVPNDPNNFAQQVTKELAKG